MTTDRLPTLRGDRLRLRWLTLADAPALLGVFGDPDVVRYWSAPALEDLAGASRLVDEIHSHFLSGTLYQWGVVVTGADDVVGTCTLASIDRPNRRAEVGFALRRDAWGQGLATDALGLLCRHAFTDLGLHRLDADVDPDNAASLRLLARLGFSEEGRLRQRWWQAGEWRDSVMLGLLEPDWRSREMT